MIYKSLSHITPLLLLLVHWVQTKNVMNLGDVSIECQKYCKTKDYRQYPCHNYDYVCKERCTIDCRPVCQNIDGAYFIMCDIIAHRDWILTSTSTPSPSKYIRRRPPKHEHTPIFEDDGDSNADKYSATFAFLIKLLVAFNAFAILVCLCVCCRYFLVARRSSQAVGPAPNEREPLRAGTATITIITAKQSPLLTQTPQQQKYPRTYSPHFLSSPYGVPYTTSAPTSTTAIQYVKKVSPRTGEEETPRRKRKSLSPASSSSSPDEPVQPKQESKRSRGSLEETSIKTIKPDATESDEVKKESQKPRSRENSGASYKSPEAKPKPRSRENSGASNKDQGTKPRSRENSSASNKDQAAKAKPRSRENSGASNKDQAATAKPRSRENSTSNQNMEAKPKPRSRENSGDSGKKAMAPEPEPSPSEPMTDRKSRADHPIVSTELSEVPHEKAWVKPWSREDEDKSEKRNSSNKAKYQAPPPPILPSGKEPEQTPESESEPEPRARSRGNSNASEKKKTAPPP